MFHICRGGPTPGRTKDKDDQFVPIHPRVRPLLETFPRAGDLVFPGVTERNLLKRIKGICREIGLSNPDKYKLHSFRHHFTSLCANHQIAYRKALSWLCHSSSQILDLYYHLHDDDSQAAMKALAADRFDEPVSDTDPERPVESPGEGTLRAMEGSKIESLSQTFEGDEFVRALDSLTERAGFEPAVRLPVHSISSRAP